MRGISRHWTRQNPVSDLRHCFWFSAGGDAFRFSLQIRSKRYVQAPTVIELLADPIYVDYATYAKHKGKIRLA